jgi:lysozyme family protein
VLPVDGVIGPKTVSAINAIEDQPALLAAFFKRVEARYRQVASANPALAGDLGFYDHKTKKGSGWLGRLYS